MKGAVRILIRFDTEDILTPASDDAAGQLAELLTRHGVRATFPITAMKVDALLQRGRQDVLRSLSRHQVGFHSTSHSLHPTIAEELAQLSGPEAAARFRAREEAGFLRVADIFGEAPRVYTQPGGNWTAEAIPALAAWGVKLFYSEDWNGYLDIQGRPMLLAGLHHWAAPVRAPKPFLNRLPGILDEAVATARAAIDEAAAAGQLALVNVVSHPTELVSEQFWDLVPFGGGQNQPETSWESPPQRPRQVVEAALDAFSAWLGSLRQMAADVEFWTGDDLVSAFPDRAIGITVQAEAQVALLRLVSGGRLGSVAVGEATLTAAEVLGVAVQAARAIQGGTFPKPLAVRTVAPPWDESEADTRRQAGEIGGPVLVEALSRLGAALDQGQLPAAVAAGGELWSPLAVAAGGARATLQVLETGAPPERVPLPRVALTSRRFVKPAEALHWDWPIFPPGFEAPALRRRAEAATWCLKPAEAELADERIGARA